jgi:hypothetical protein
LWVKEGCRGHEGTLDGTFSGVVGLGRFEVVDDVSDSAQKFPGLVLFREQEFDVVRSLGDDEIDQSQVLKNCVLFSNKLGEVVELRSDFLEGLLDDLFVLFPEILGKLGPDVVKNTDDGFDSD